MRFTLGDSSFCGTTIAFESSLFSVYDFHNSLLRSAKLSGVLNSADFTSADLQDADFSGAYVSHTSFVGADLRRSVLWGGGFTDSDFNGADLRDVRFALGIEIPGIILAQAQDKKHYWWIRSDAGYYDVYTYSADPDSTVINPDADDNDAIRVFYPNYTEIFGDTPVDLTRSRFHWADIRGADFSATNLTQQQLDSSCADTTTRLPDGITLRKECTIEQLDKIARQRAALFSMHLPTASAAALPDCDTAAGLVIRAAR